MTEEQKRIALENIAARRAREEKLRASRDVRWTSRKEGEEKSHNAVKGTLASIGVGAREGVKNTVVNAKAFVQTDLGTGKAQGLKTAEKAVSENVDYDEFMNQMRAKYGRVQTFWPMKMSQEDRDMYASVLQKKKLGLSDKQSLAQAQSEQEERQRAIDAERLVRSIKSQKALQAVDDKYELGKVGEFAQDVGGAFGQMLPSLGVGVVNPAAGLATFGVQAAAQGYGQALDSGATHEQAARYGVGTGLLEAGIEKATGGLSRFYGRGVLDKAMRMAPNDSVKRVLSNTVKGSLGEGAEEAVSAIADPYLQRATYDPDAKNASFSDAAYQAAIGAALGGMLGGGANALGYRAQKKKAAERAQTGVQGAQNVGLNGDVESRRTAENGQDYGAESNYTPEEAAKYERIKSEYQASTDKNLVQYAENIRQNQEVEKSYELKNVTEKESNDIEKLVGFNTAGFKTVIEPRIVKHIESRHGENGQADKSMADLNDLGRIQYVMDNYDTIYYGGKSKAYKTPKKMSDGTTKTVSADTVAYEKRIDGFVYVIKAVPNAQKRTTYIDSVFITKKDKSPLFVDATNAPRRNVQDATMNNLSSNSTIAAKDFAVKYNPPKTPYEQAYDDMLRGENSTKPKAETEDERRVKDFIQSAAVRARMQVKYVDRPPVQKAYYKDGVIYINKNRPIDEGVKVTMAHELYHAMEGTKEHEAIVKLAFEGKDAEAMIAEKISSYRERGVTLDEEGARAEIGAEFIEKALTDEATINQVLLEDRTLAAKILERIKEIIAVYKAKKSMKAAEAREYAALLKARRLYEDGLEKLHKGEYSPAGVERARYQLLGTNENGIEVYETPDEIKKLPYRERKEKFLDLMRNEYRGRTAKFMIGNEAYYARFEDADLKKNIYGDKLSDKQGYNAKINAGASGDIFELVENARYDGSKKDIGKTAKAHEDVIGWDYFVKQVQIDGRVYDLVANVRKKTDGEYVYSIQLNANKKIEASPYVVDGKTATSIEGQHASIDTNNITNSAENVNSKSVENENFSKERYALGDNGGINGERYNELIDRYGRIDEGMEPREDVAVPKQVNDWNKTRRFVRTAMESENVSAEAKDKIADSLASDIRDGKFVYEPVSNQKLQEKANANIAKVGYEKSKAEIFAKYQKNERIKAEDVATLEQLIVKASAEGKAEEVMDMVGLASMIGTEMGQSIQALSMVKRMSPEGRLRQMTLLRDRLNSKYELTGESQVEINSRYAEMMLDKNNSSENRDTIQSYIIDDMAKQLPVDMKDKFDAWRYLAMLGNPRTHMRNVIGNILNLSISRLNDQLAGIVEAAVIKNGGERTKSAGAVSKELKEFAKVDWENNGRKRTDLSNKYGERGQAERNRKIFTSKLMQPVEKGRKWNENAMDAEDTWFKQKQYIYALSHYMKANNITPEIMQIENSPIAERARQYAEDEAYRVTFQEENALASALNHFEHKNTDSKLEKGGQLAVKALMPFKKTPLNILKRGVEYSPAGLINGINDAIKLVRKGDIPATQVINEITQGLTGTGIVALGYFLAEAGLLSAGYDEGNKREQNYENQIGGQNYAITLPGGGTYTLDWAAPTVMPLFVGAALNDEISSREEGENIGLRDIGSALIKVTDPVLEMSCMDSLQSALESYGNEGAISNMITSAATSYVMQFVPTLSGQFARTIDETKRSTYAPSDSKYTKTGESLGRQFMNKVPGLSYKSEAAVDVWGRERKQAGGNIAGRAFNNMLSPGTYSSNKETATDKELKRLYEASGESGVLPKMGSKYISYKADGEKSKTYYLTSKEYTKYQTKYGQDNFNAVSELMRSNVYKKMSDEDKAAAVKEIYTYNAQMANKEFFKGRNVSYDAGASTTEKLKDAGGWANYFAIKNAFPDSNYDVAKKRKEKCDKYGIDYTAYAESNAKIAELRSANSERYTKASDKTEANKRAIAQYLASRKDLTNPQRQVIWQEYYNGKTSETYKSVAGRYGF